ncbi:MAG: 50S ribosomal protein L29 [Planctomycetes bacterium]|nr:50S ribosomal protein L29 [Planctomycetota bacterium]
MKIGELRTQEAAELDFLLKEKRKRMFDLRFKAASEEISDTKELVRLRRDVARILTIQGERARAKLAEVKVDGK